MAKSKRKASKPSKAKTSRATSARTSSPASVGGTTPFGSPDSRQTDLFGLPAAPASPSAAQARARASKTRGTSGPTSQPSSASIDLQSCLESRLRARTASGGSTLFSLTWKQWATPSGRAFCLLRARAHRTSDTASSSWPTPLAHDAKHPTSEAVRDRQKAAGHGVSNLNETARLAGWPTTRASDSDRGTETSASRAARTDGGPDLPSTAVLAGWATPVATEIGNTLESYLAMKANMKSGPRTAITHPSLQAQLASWMTPTSRDHKDSAGQSATSTNPDGSLRSRLDLLGRQVQLAGSGPTLTGSSVGTVGGGLLNPEHSRWLMGFPSAWARCEPTAMRSTRQLPLFSLHP